MEKHRNRVLAACASLAATAAIVVPALATPSSGFTRTEISTGLLGEVETRAEVKGDKGDKWELRLRTRDDSDLGLDRLTIADGGHSGWHTHAGITMVTVVAGEVVWYDGASPGCPSKTYRVGDSFVEPADNVHLVQNISGGTAEFTAVQIRPRGAAGRIDAAQPADCPTF
jgi:quercetin dioxygenase-like cupin family protein